MTRPDICLISVLCLLKATCSGELRRKLEVTFAPFLIFGGEHSRVVADINEDEDEDDVASAIFFERDLVVFTIVLKDGYDWRRLWYRGASVQVVGRFWIRYIHPKNIRYIFFG